MNLSTTIQSYLDQIPVEDLGLGMRGHELGNLVFQRPFLVMHQLLNLYTQAQSLGLLLDLGLEPALKAGSDLQQLIQGLHPQSRIPIEWTLNFLAREGVLVEAEGRVKRFRLERDPGFNLMEIRGVAAQMAPGHEPSFDLLDAVRRQIKPFFTEGKSGDKLLFDLTFFPLWLGYFRNENLVYRCNNAFTLIALQDGLKSGTRVLELGGGAGSFAQLLAQDAAEQGYLDRFTDYCFSDVAPAFLTRARRGLAQSAPGLPFRFSTLDVNRPLAEQKMAEACFDVILGVNVLHVAKDLSWTLAMLKDHLAPGGRLIVGECLKPSFHQPIYVEWLFQFVSSFTDVDTDPEYRPTFGFLTPEAWVKLLHHAGYQDVREVPKARPFMERLPAFYVGAFDARVETCANACINTRVDSRANACADARVDRISTSLDSRVSSR